MLWLCDRWQQKGALSVWNLMWKCVWSKGVPLNSSMPENIDIHLRLLNACRHQTVDVSAERQWPVRFGTGDSNVGDKLCCGWPCIALMI